MATRIWQAIRLTAMFALAVPFLVPQTAAAQDHVLSAGELQAEMRAAAKSRQSNLEKVEKFFSSESAKHALQSARLDTAKVQKAVSFLSDEEMARLAAKTEKVRTDFAAGALTNQQITYIIIALATAVLILVIVVA